jgi:hypothetical protein
MLSYGNNTYVSSEVISKNKMFLAYVCTIFIVCGECKYQTIGGRVGRTSAVSSLDKWLQKI